MEQCDKNMVNNFEIWIVFIGFFRVNVLGLEEELIYWFFYLNFFYGICFFFIFMNFYRYFIDLVLCWERRKFDKWQLFLLYYIYVFMELRKKWKK